MPINTSDNRWSVAAITVDPTSGKGDYTTITTAIAAASSGNTIFIRPGTYTENFTLKAGVNLSAFDCDALTPNVTITGKITVTGAGTSSISGLRLQTNSDFCLVVDTATLNLKNCVVSFTNSAGISQASGVINLFQCTGSASTGNALFTNTGGSINFYGCKIDGSGSSTAATASGGFVIIYGSKFTNPFTTTSTAAFTISYSEVNTGATNSIALTIGGSGNNNVQNSKILSGSGASISAGGTVLISNTTINSTNTNPITGAGQVSIASVDFIAAGVGINTTTQVALTTTLGSLSGNLAFLTSGNKITAPAATTTAAGANSFGTVVLVGGTATVSTTAVTTSSIILLTNQVLGTVAVASGYAVTSRTNATSFVITASAPTDTSTIGWQIIN